ncbi:hypothetical protein TorRG33x02_007230 [Trema orientale]|uniref:Uncharacterized protein n=1 Tax=Trema orientale TaxID=63057 RepID=A0A2P5G0C8_TREOI|nr:hypothetical protein TorRG33x02_007230 [Trema orientale]
MNVDVPVDEKVGFIRILVVIHDSNDQVRGAMTSKKERHFNANLVKCLAL